MENSVVTGGKLLSYESDYAVKRYRLLEEILQNVKEGNEFQACRLFQSRSEIELPGVIKDELSELKYDLVAVESLILYRLSENSAAQYRIGTIHADFQKGIYLAETAEECVQKMESALRGYCALNRSAKEKSYSSITQKIILAVDMDLTKPLTLQYFAEDLSVNSSYLSDLFRREVGETITEYVTSRRIDHAKGLLAVSQNPIKTVAKMVGIPDVQYFSKIFKRRTGQTPGQYRQNCDQRQENKKGKEAWSDPAEK